MKDAERIQRDIANNLNDHRDVLVDFVEADNPEIAKEREILVKLAAEEKELNQQWLRARTKREVQQRKIERMSVEANRSKS